MIKPCLQCGKLLMTTGRRARHPDCQKAFIRERANSPAEKLKNKAQRAAQHAIRTGKLVRQPCQKNGCGRTPTHGHHTDYSKPLEVIWLCPMHHSWEHSQQR